mmetsp:Transcript_37009/g.104484  ORF Transcript_37009/g.104484 Transcript_37009/m.104484 type:complete len:272 (+) Transcript_37009:164-979(+)
MCGGSAHHLADDSLQESFTKTLGMVVLSELGDKTFFMAALLAMRYGRSRVFAGAWGALAVMTCLSTALGWAAPRLIPDEIVHIGAVVLFFCFGLHMTYQAITWEEPEVSELEEVEAELKTHTFSGASPPDSPGGAEGAPALGGSQNGELRKRPGKEPSATANVNGPGNLTPQRSLKKRVSRALSPIIVESFLLTFVAEWGDRSQMATIGLAMAGDAAGVCLGGTAGHAICTGIAVVGGKRLARFINERIVLGCGAVMFLLFGLRAAVDLLR